MALLPTPFCAVIVIGKLPQAVATPLNTPVAGVNVTPVGNVPVIETVGAGDPVAVTVNEPAAPVVNVALFALVIAGATNVIVLTL